MNRLAIATIATATPMGSQVYEAHIKDGASAALAASGEDWEIEQIVARSLRSQLPGSRRIPVSVLETRGLTARRAVGRAIYPRGVLVHRMGLTLPPAPREIVTMHDTVAWNYPDEGRPIASVGAELRAAAAVVCVSRFTADQVAERFGVTTTRVVHLGVDDRFRNADPLDPGTLRGLGIEGRFVLHAGGASRRKNLPALAAAWHRVRVAAPDVSLVMVGPTHPARTALFENIPGVIMLGRVDEALVQGLLASACAIAVPSVDEGFGLPVLEGMAVGTPVVASDSSSIPEVAGDGALLVPPTGDGIADGLIAILQEQVDVPGLVRRGRERASEFTWQRCLAGHAEVWASVA